MRGFGDIHNRQSDTLDRGDEDITLGGKITDAKAISGMPHDPRAKGIGYIKDKQTVGADTCNQGSKHIDRPQRIGLIVGLQEEGPFGIGQPQDQKTA